VSGHPYPHSGVRGSVTREEAAVLIGSRGVLSPVWGASVDPFHRLVDAGMAVASVSYRLSSEARRAAQLHDVAAAARYLVVRADELGIDLSRVAAWGASSGGQLALLAALLRQDEAVSGRGAAVAMPDFAAVVDWCAPVDLRVPLPTLGMPPPEPVERLLGADPAEVPDLARLASPLLQVRQPLPPTLIAHGVDDVIVPRQGSRLLADAVAAAGTDVQLELTPGGHMWLDSPDRADEVLRSTVAFLGRYLAL